MLLLALNNFWLLARDGFIELCLAQTKLPEKVSINHLIFLYVFLFIGVGEKAKSLCKKIWSVKNSFIQISTIEIHIEWDKNLIYIEINRNTKQLFSVGYIRNF
jgi:hypothetical protein